MGPLCLHVYIGRGSSSTEAAMLHGYVSTRTAQNGHTAQERTHFQSVILITIYCNLQGMDRLTGYIQNTFINLSILAAIIDNDT